MNSFQLHTQIYKLFHEITTPLNSKYPIQLVFMNKTIYGIFSQIVQLHPIALIN